MELPKILEIITTKVVESGPSVLLAIVTLYIGFKLSNLVRALVLKATQANGTDISVSTFLASMAGTVVKIFMIITAASTLGIQTTSFAAALGGSFLAIGVALQGTIAHVAAGFMILVFRPFKVGDIIVAQGFTGRVREIQLFCTILTTSDNQTIIIPNGALSSGTTQNATYQERRRVDVPCTINGLNFDEAKAKLAAILAGSSLILEGSEPVVTGIAAGAVTFSVRAWTATENFDKVNAYLLEAIKKASEAGSIAI